MHRITNTPKTSLLEGKRVIVTGCGYKPINHIFHDIVDKTPTHDEVFINHGLKPGIKEQDGTIHHHGCDIREMKANIGTAISAVLARNGADVLMIGHNDDKITGIKDALLNELSSGIKIDDHLAREFDKDLHINGTAVDLLDEKSVKEFVSQLPTDKPIYRVQSVGLGAGSYQLKNDNPYLPLEEMDVGLIEAEATTVLKGTHILMREILPILKKQQESRIVIISSMSAIRGYALGSSHCPAKAAIDKYANVAMLKLYKDNIRVSTVRPGAVDTGMYDSPESRDAVRDISAEHDGTWKTDDDIVLMPPTAVGQVVNTILTSPAHIAEVNMVSKSQFPHQGS